MVSWYLSTLKNALDEKHLVTHNMHSLRHDFPRFLLTFQVQRKQYHKLRNSYILPYKQAYKAYKITENVIVTKNVIITKS